MDIYALFILAGIIIFLGFVGEFVFRKTNIPDVIWLMIFGIIIGPAFNFVQPESIVTIAPVFTTFALIFILFEGALNLKVRELFRGAAGGFVLALVNFIASVAVTTVIALLFGFGFVQSVLLGAVLGGTSSAVIIPIIKRLNIGKSTAASLTLESAFSDVLCIVAAVSIIQIYQIGVLQINSLVSGLLNSFVVSLFIGAIAGYIWIRVLYKLSHYVKSYMITIGFMLLIYGLTEYIGSNGAIACLAFGIMLGNADKIFKAFHNVENGAAIKGPELFFYAEVSFAIKSFFFVYLGILLQFKNVVPYLIALAIVVGLYLVRPVSTLTLGRGVSPKDKAMVDGLVPKGLAAAVLAQLPAQMGIPGTELFADVVLSVILITILASTVFVFLVEKNMFGGITSWYSRLFSRRPKMPESSDMNKQQ